MLTALVRGSIRHRVVVLGLAAALVVVGANTLGRAPLDVFPEFAPPQVSIQTEAPGLSPEQVELQVTKPIEDAINGVLGIAAVRSHSIQGLSVVTAVLAERVDIHLARQALAERLGEVAVRLPDTVEPPVLTPLTSSSSTVLVIGITSDSVTPMEQRTFVDWVLRPRLLAVLGVSKVAVFGGEVRQLQIQLDPERLRVHGVGIAEAAEAARRSTGVRGGGVLDQSSQRLTVRAEGQVGSPDRLAQTVVREREGRVLRLGDLGRVTYAPETRFGEGGVNGERGIVVVVSGQLGSNTKVVAGRVEAALARLRPTIAAAGLELHPSLFRPSEFIDLALRNITTSLLLGAVLVSVVLFLFLADARAAAISLTAIPLSLLAAILALEYLGFGINTLTLGGLAIALGEVVDDAIIDVENVFRRLKQNRAGPESERRPPAEVIFDASNEIRPAMVFATVIIVMVFVPLLFLQGLEGRFFRPLALTYMVSIIASLLVALTVTPALCRYLLKGKIGGAHEERDGFLVRWLKRWYEPALRGAIRFRVWVLGAAAVATAAALWLASTFGTSFLPSFNEGTFTVFLFAPPGTSLTESNRLASGVEQRLTEIDGVETVARRTGRAENDEHAEPVSSSEIEVTVQPGRDREVIRAEIDVILASVPGIVTQVGQPIEHRLSHVLSGTPAAIAISVYGDDLSMLRSIAKEIESEIKSLPGARDVNANREVMITSLPIRYRHDELAAAGFSPADAAEQVREAVYGEVVATVNQGLRQYDLVVRLAADQRKDIEQIKNLLLRGRSGAIVRLRDVADIGPERSSNLITRENAQRKAVISLNVAENANLGDLVATVRERVTPIVRKAGYTVEYGGQFEAQQSAARTIAVAGVGIVVVMLMFLQLSTGSMRAAVLVMLNMPLALIGGIAAIYLTEGGGVVRNTLALIGAGETYVPPVISIAGMVGFITLFGIAVRNGILLINHYNHLMKEEQVPLGEAIVQGSMERLVPILMTALCAALGLAPLALAAGKPGSELLAPLAIVTLGGLLTSTFLNLIVVPAGYSLVFGHKLTAHAAHAARKPSPGHVTTTLTPNTEA